MEIVNFAFGSYSVVNDILNIKLNFYATFLAICIVLWLGVFITKRWSLLRNYSIPIPVTGGLVVAFLLFLLQVIWNVKIGFEESIKEPFMLMFFTSVGLSADFNILKKGGKLLVLFGISVCTFLFVQNIIGISVITILGENPLIGLLAGSVTLSGGHGTGAAWGAVFSQSPYSFPLAVEVAMASATYGLIAGGLLGGPVAGRLIKRYNLKPTDKVSKNSLSDEVFSEPLKPRLITSESLLKTLGLFAISMFVGTTIGELSKGSFITIPTFVWCLFAGIIVRNLLSYFKIHQIFDREVGVIGNVSLFFFLAMALMSLNLVELTKIAGPLTILLGIQTIAMVLWARYITFGICGKDYDAACLVAGHCGFGMGATPTAVANLQAVTNQFGPSHIAFIVVPIMGGFFVDIANVLVISTFLVLPIFP
ncbi:MAG: sodium/glutamate symporter [Campylobacter sp.]|nr:sodium/glutamate symporter [Campylobacter sp.]